MGIDQKQDDVGFLQDVESSFDHTLIEQGARMAVDARRIDKDQLRLGQSFNTNDTITGHLRFGGDNRHLGANQGVEQGRLADVRPPDQSDKTATVLRIGRRQRSIHCKTPEVAVGARAPSSRSWRRVEDDLDHAAPTDLQDGLPLCGDL